jgi:beta-lactam-binding protein with PASTA domain
VSVSTSSKPSTAVNAAATTSGTFGRVISGAKSWILEFPANFRSKSSFRLISIGSLVVAIGLVVLLILVNLVASPSLAGLSLSQAMDKARSAGYEISEKTIEWAENPEIPQRFQVVETQLPVAGSTNWRGSNIALVMKPAPIEVPSLRGLTQAEARTKLSDAGLQALSEFSEGPAEKWRVIGQSVRAGIVIDAWTEVTLEFEVPNVAAESLVGMSLSKAQSAAKLGFYSVTFSPTTAESDWEVVAQDPIAGASVRYGSKIALTLLPPRVDVPNIVGKSQTDARKLLEDAGFVVSFEPAGSESGWSIASQSPAPGELARLGDTVRVTVVQPVITFEVTGSGSATVTWIAPGGGFNIQQDTDARLPWSKSFPYRSGLSSYQYGNFNAQSYGGSSITCTMTVNGRVVSSNTSTGAYAVVSCG